MNKIVHYIGLDVHKETIAVSIAPQNSTEVRRYGIIGGTLDAVDKLVKNSRRKISSCTWFTKPGRAALSCAAICAAGAFIAKSSRPRSFPGRRPIA